MYVAYGWPKVLSTASPDPIVYIKASSDLLLLVSTSHLEVWSIAQHKSRLAQYFRGHVSSCHEGHNTQAIWSGDTKTILVLTSAHFLLCFKLSFSTKNIRFGGKESSGVFLGNLSLTSSLKAPFLGDIASTSNFVGNNDVALLGLAHGALHLITWSGEPDAQNQNMAGRPRMNFGSGMPLLNAPAYDNLTPKGKPKDYKEGGQAVKFDTFHGTHDKLKALLFLQQFDAAFAGGNFTEASKIRKAATFFKTNALQWWTTMLNQGVVPSTWVQFKQIFAPAWITNTFKVDVMTAWNQLSAINCESLEEYNAKFWDALLPVSSFKMVPLAKQIEKYCCGLPKGIKKYCTKTSVMNMAQLMENAEVADDLIQGKPDEDGFKTRRKEPQGKQFSAKGNVTSRLTVPPFKKKPFAGSKPFAGNRPFNTENKPNAENQRFRPPFSGQRQGFKRHFTGKTIEERKALRDARKCYICEEEGHFANECPQRNSQNKDDKSDSKGKKPKPSAGLVPDLFVDSMDFSEDGKVLPDRLSTKDSNGDFSRSPRREFLGTACLNFVHLELSVQLNLLTALFEDGRVLICSTSKNGVKKAADIVPYRWIGINDAICVSIASEQNLLAVGSKSGAISLFDLADNVTLIRTISLYDWGYSMEDTGAVSCIRWTPDNTAFAVGWQLRGLAVWSSSGCRLMSTIRQSGLNMAFSPVVKPGQDLLRCEPLSGGVACLDWDENAYQLYALESRAATRMLSFSFGKCCLNRGVSGVSHLRQIICGEDRVLLLQTEDEDELKIQHLIVPQSYISQNWPLLHVSASKDGTHLAMAGRRGLILYDLR
ncbi:hypothetical protein L7F22_017910 [Adiantum nelumboides]|nr:hypothetical protein [Adiantum nelumboides]